jgi:mannose-1-phosphate guanylyltransferase
VTNIRAILLAAGLGTRLRPYTDNWPKCLMPIGKRPLLAYWLEYVKMMGIEKTLVNLHYHHQIVEDFLSRPIYQSQVHSVFEAQLLGTAGTIRANKDFIGQNTLLLVHADNWSVCDWKDFVTFHNFKRPENCLITMMTFHCENPSTCGILELDEQGVVIRMHEKALEPPGNLANAAVYLIEPEVVDWICDRPWISDFSIEVIPSFMGRIATWHNNMIHRDIGTPEVLVKAQFDSIPPFTMPMDDSWGKDFLENPILLDINQLINKTYPV